MILHIAVTDDNISDLTYISSLVKQWARQSGNAAVLSAFTSAEAFLFQYEESQEYDILLLDIEMGEMNGIELAKTIREKDTRIQLVFITGFPDFMAEGYEVFALHYLMKPVSFEKLSAVLYRAAANLEKAEKRLRIVYDHEVSLIPVSRILYVEAQKQYVLIHTEDTEYRMKTSLTGISRELDEFFFQCQRSFLVNLRQITKIKGDCVVLKNGKEVPISRGMAEKIGKEMIRLF